MILVNICLLRHADTRIAELLHRFRFVTVRLVCLYGPLRAYQVLTPYPRTMFILLRDTINNMQLLNAVKDIVSQIVKRKIWFSSHISSRKCLITRFSASRETAVFFVSQATFVKIFGLGVYIRMPNVTRCCYTICLYLLLSVHSITLRSSLMSQRCCRGETVDDLVSMVAASLPPADLLRRCL